MLICKLLLIIVIILILILSVNYDHIEKLESVDGITSISVDVDDINELLTETAVQLGSGKISLDKMKGDKIIIRANLEKMHIKTKEEETIELFDKININGFDDYLIVLGDRTSIDAPKNPLTISSGSDKPIIIKGYEKREINNENELIISGTNINISGIVNLYMHEFKMKDEKDGMQELLERKYKIIRKMDNYSWFSKSWYKNDYDELKKELIKVEEEIEELYK